MQDAITLRPIEPADEAFLYEVYASTRTTELEVTGWSDEQKTAFLQMQFTAQHRYYHENYDHAVFDIILVGGTPVGRLYVNRGSEDVRIIDIALLPAARGRGIGTHLIGALQAEAALARKPLTIHVERFNQALRLYERLGFKPIADRGVYLLLEWRSSE